MTEDPEKTEVPKKAEGPKKVSAKDFALFGWVETIPLTDDLWLRMQAQNIAVIQMAVLRPMENSALEEFYANDRYSPETLQTLSSLSQMWDIRAIRISADLARAREQADQ